jgi:glycerol-3-phosphate acyltransferase PlsY
MMEGNMEIRSKVILGIAIWIFYGFIERMLSTSLVNYATTKQMENSNSALYDYSVNMFIYRFSWIVPLAICILLFWREIKNLYYTLRGGF